MASAMIRTDFPGLCLLNRGKVRDMYVIPGHEDVLLMVATDRISAYDIIMDEPILGKGMVLTKLSLFWLDLLGDIIPNHLITADVEKYPAECQSYKELLRGRSMLVRKAAPLPVECIVRGYISGSFWSAYKKSPDGTVCGFHLPRGLRESEKFPKPLFTPSTKAALGQHDENISFERMEEIIGQDLARRVRAACLALYERAAEYASDRGIIIADTKFELGILPDGELILIDEVLTPDSSRFWPVNEYEVGRSQPSFDKQFLRDYLQGLVDAGEWDKKAPAPKLPSEVLTKTRSRYETALRLLTRKC